MGKNKKHHVYRTTLKILSLLKGYNTYTELARAINVNIHTLYQLIYYPDRAWSNRIADKISKALGSNEWYGYITLKPAEAENER